MPKQATPLAPTQVSSAKPKGQPYKLHDAGRLFLVVYPSGTKSWYRNYRLDDKECTIGYGQYPAVSLADARALRADDDRLLAKGIDPRQFRKDQEEAAQKEKTSTLAAVTEEWISKNKSKWSPYYLQQIENFLGRYIIHAKIGKNPIKDVEVLDIVHLIEGIAERKAPDTKIGEKKDKAPSIASHTRMWLGAVFRMAILKGYCSRNPVSDIKLGDIVSKPKVKHNRALKVDELQGLMLKLSDYKGTRTTKIALELLIRTFVRTVELRKSCWSEFDLDKGVWHIPAERMKMKVDHVVPLSTQSVELLRELKALHPHPLHGPHYLFPNERRHYPNAKAVEPHMASMTLNRALQNMGYENGGFRAHGCRGTASTLLRKLKFSHEVIEMQLAHRVGNEVSAAYNQFDYWDD
jgi:integrase